MRFDSNNVINHSIISCVNILVSFNTDTFDYTIGCRINFYDLSDTSICEPMRRINTNILCSFYFHKMLLKDRGND